MNKKIFAALASATMALSATGSLAVFAEDFDVVTEADSNNGTANGVVVANGQVKLNSENFPDGNFLNTLLKELGKNYGDSVKVSTVTELTFGNDVKDLAGVEAFTSLETISSADAAALKTADLSKNTKLKAVSITGAISLTNLTLPEGKSLEVLILTGSPAKKAPITELNLSGNKFLTSVWINNTEIAKLDLSNNVYLTSADLSSNDLNTVDITNCASLTTFDASNNELYGIELPVNKVLTTLDVSNNLLQELDVTPTPAIVSLKADNNELRTIDLSDLKNLTTIRLTENHLGALEIPNNTYKGWSNAANRADTDSWVNGQVVYVDPAYNAVNLTEAFENIDTDKVDVTLFNGQTADQFDKKTGVLKLNEDGPTYYGYKHATGSYVYVAVIKADVLNRLYNPNSGEHFYTKDLNEKDTLVELGWKDEGTAWVSPTAATNKPVYRLYNPNAGDHHYTMNAYEKDALVSVGWKFEGVGWNDYTSDVNYNFNVTNDNGGYTIKGVDVLREYNPNAKAAGAHNYTINPAENDFLVTVGWLDEGIGWNSMK